MKLYHGTSASKIRAILKKGIQPRGNKRGNWKGNPSNPNSVYLTNVYAPYFAICATAKNKAAVVLEIDTDWLYALHADEDILYHAMKRGQYTESTPGNRVKDAENFCYTLSLDAMGTCAHAGVIPPEAITRIATFTPKAFEFWCASLDPIIAPMNYTFCKKRYEHLTAWLFGDVEYDEKYDRRKILETETDIAEAWSARDKWTPKSREGITVEVINQPLLKQFA